MTDAALGLICMVRYEPSQYCDLHLIGGGGWFVAFSCQSERSPCSLPDCCRSVAMHDSYVCTCDWHATFSGILFV